MWNVMKKRSRDFQSAKAAEKRALLTQHRKDLASDFETYGPPSDPAKKGDIQMSAADHLDKLNAASGSGPADETGPFENKTTRNEITGGSLLGNVLPHAAEGESSPSRSTSPPSTDDPKGMADHHQKLADYFNKIAHPGSQSLPATTQTNDYEKSELKDDTDMKPEY